MLCVKSGEICSKQIDFSGKQLGTMEPHKYLMKFNTLWWRNSVWLKIFCVITQNQTHFPPECALMTQLHFPGRTLRNLFGT